MPRRSTFHAPDLAVRLSLFAFAFALGALCACNQLIGNEPQSVTQPDPGPREAGSPNEAGTPPDSGASDSALRCEAGPISSCGGEEEDAGPADPCTREPCLRGACRADGDAFRCDCPSGYDGPTCAHAIEGCPAQPCLRGTCKNLNGGGYECVCPKGFDGVACEHDVDDCAAKPCQHGRCQDLSDAAGYRCTCPSGYEGTNCERDIDECAAAPCASGTCTNLPGGGYQCACPAGYDGMNCELDIDECAPEPCVHGACTDEVNGFSCRCQAGWGGATCAAGSCTGVSCASTAPCTVPAGNAGICLPTACGSKSGLCLAYNPDGGGNASTELLTQTNNDWNFGANNDWNDKSRYFSYVHAISDFPYVCVFPQKNLGGTPLVIPLGQSRTAAAGFGQSNAFSNATQCSAHAP